MGVKRLLKWWGIAAFLLLSGRCFGQVSPITGFCAQGAIPALTSGLPSTNNLQGIIPQCSVTVYLTGTLTKATLYSNSGLTPLSNPFTATSAGQWTFFVAVGQGYDVVLSGGGGNPLCTTPPNCYTSPFTIATGVLPSSSSSGTVIPSPQFSLFYQPNSGVTSAAQGDPLINTDGSGDMTAAAVNAVVDFKAKFGASGSQQTMTCTSNASATLTGCTGGDFKVGQYVYLPAMGVLPTISAPSAPTLVSHATSTPAWSASVTYSLNQLVTSGGTTYYSLINGNLNNTPASSPSDWASDGSAAPGTTVYSYQIVAIQGGPNGATTAASTSATITQAAQIIQQQSGSGKQDVYTALSGYGVTGALFYAIYKSINGGAFTFYTTLPGTTFNDYGNSGAVIFTCTDLAISCTPPTSAVPNDVYAQITVISGGSVTLAAWPTQPKPTTSFTGFTTYPSTPSVSGTVVVQHDDTHALAAFGDYVRSTGGNVELHIPTGAYNLHNADPYGGPTALAMSNFYNVTIAGDGPSSRLYQSSDRYEGAGSFMRGTCGQAGSFSPASNCQAWEAMAGGLPKGSGLTITITVSGGVITGGTIVGGGSGYVAGTNVAVNQAGGNSGVFNITSISGSAVTGITLLQGGSGYTAASAVATFPIAKLLVDPVPAGTSVVTLQNSADTSHFAVGEYVTLSTVAVCGSGSVSPCPGLYPQEYYGELNLITSINSSTGQINLAYPSGKYYSSALTAPYSSCPYCEGTPQLGIVYPVPVSTNVILHDFSYRGSNVFLNYNTNDYLTEYNLVLVVGGIGTEGFSRHQSVHDNSITEDSWIRFDQGLITNAAGSSDYTVVGNTYNSPHTDWGPQPCSEGGANVYWAGNHMILSGAGEGFTSSNQNFMGASNCINFSFIYNTVTLQNTNFGNVLFSQDNTGVGVMAWNRFNIDTMGPNVQASALNKAGTTTGLITNMHIFSNDWNIGTCVSTNGCGQNSQSANTMQLPTLSATTFPGTTSGSLSIYQYLAAQQITIIPVTGNVTSVNLGNNRYPGLYFWLDFQQAASGGPYTLPADCTNTHWTTTGTNGIICPNGPPVISPVAGMDTFFQFYDDGTNVFFLSTSYSPYVLAYPNGTPTYTAGTNVTSCVKASTFTNTNTRGSVTIVGGTATTGTICTVNFSTTLPTAPGLCRATQNGGAALYNIGDGAPTTGGFAITAGASVSGATLQVDYSCLP